MTMEELPDGVGHRAEYVLRVVYAAGVFDLFPERHLEEAVLSRGVVVGIGSTSSSSARRTIVRATRPSRSINSRAASRTPAAVQPLPRRYDRGIDVVLDRHVRPPQDPGVGSG